MIELLTDLVGTRLRFPPVPITLLNTLAIVSLNTLIYIVFIEFLCIVV